jgi:ADP-heptose:LPS heptosyltransferase
MQSLFFNKQNKNPENIKNILIVRLNHIGDLFITLPTIFSLRNKFPQAGLTLVTGVWNKGVVEFQKYLFDNVYYYNLSVNCRAKSQKLSFLKKITILKELKRNSYDLCVDFDGSWGFLFFYLFSKIKYLSTAEYLHFCQNLGQLGIFKNKFNYDINYNHESDNLFEVVKQFSVNDQRSRFKLKIDEKTEKVVSEYFTSIKSGKKIAGIHPAASIKEKMWSTEGFAILCNYLIEQKNCAILFFGSKDDAPYINEIVDKIPHNAEVNIQTTFTIGEFITAVPYCNYFICMDSLAQHIAQYYEIPALIIYMAKNSARWSKSKQNIRAVILEDKKNYDKIIEAAKEFLGECKNEG